MLICPLRTFVGAGVLAALAAGCGGSHRSDPLTRDVLLPFLEAREAFNREVVRREGYEVPPEYDRVLRAIRAGDMDAASNAVAATRSPEAAARALKTDTWQYILEMYGAFEQFRLWSPDLLAFYAHEIVGCIPSNAVYFGGTDPGRFVITAFQEVERRPFHVITQNALADNAYMAYLRHRVGDALWIPSADDSNRAFQQYVSDVQSGRIPAGADVSIQNGRVTVTGVQGVMAINGLIARMIFDANKTNHAFFIEESYVIPWMYPYLEPHGPILKLNPEPLAALPTAAVEADRAYWAACTERLLAMPAYGTDAPAQRSFSKLRSAVGGLYVYRKQYDEAETAFRQAIRLDPTSPEANFRLADAYIQQERYDDAKAVVRGLLEHKPDRPELVENFLRQIDQLAAQKKQTGTPR